MEKKTLAIGKAAPLDERESGLEPRFQQQPVVCGVVHAACDRNPKCTCTVVVDNTGHHAGTHTSPFHIWF